MKKFYTLPEAADFLEVQTHDVLRLIQDGDLAVSFDADEELAGVTIESPDGSIEHVPFPVPMTGVLSFWGDNVVEGALKAVGVRVLKVRSITFEHTPDGVRAKGCKLPTVDANTGYVKTGYIVRGFVDFVRVESADWLFFKDDLAAANEDVKDDAEPPATVTAPADPATDDDCAIADLFDPVKTAQLEAMFPDADKWKGYAERADRNGLKAAAKRERGLFNPYRAADWWLGQGPKGWKRERCLRVLASNLPARSIDSKHLLTGEYE
jgi:hypothetical protein